MNMRIFKRITLVGAIIALTIIQIAWINPVWPWFNCLFLFILIYTAYSRSPGALAYAAVAGFFLEAISTQHTGMAFISMLGAVLVMLILEKTVLASTNILSVGVLALAGSVVFAIGSYLQALITSAIFLHQPLIIYHPWTLLGLFFLSVLIVFSLHAMMKAALDRWLPNIHKTIYGVFG